MWSVNFTILYVVAIFFISLFLVKKAINSYEDYSLCGRSLTAVYIFMTYLGTWIGGGTIIGLASWSYLSGVSKYWVLSIPCIVGFPFAVLFITRIRRMGQYSIGDMLALRYPKYFGIVRIPVAIAIIIRNVTVIGMQFSAISLLLTYAFNLDRNLAVLITFLVLTSYTALSGLWGVVTTDILQGLLQTVGLAMLFFQSLKVSGGWAKANLYYQSIDQIQFLSLIDGSNWWNQMGVYLLTIGLFFLISDQGDWQRINSCKTDKTAFWGYLTPLSVTMIWLLIPAYVGVLQRVSLSTEIPYQYATYRFIIEMFSPAVGALVLVCLFASVMSSADSFLLATGLTFSRDIIKYFLNRAATDKEMIFWSRFFTLVAGGMGFAFAIIIDDLIGLWIIGIIISTSILLVPYLLAWFSKGMNTEGAFAGMIAGGILSLLWVFLSSPYNIHPIWVGIGGNLAVSMLVRLFTESPREKEIMATYYWSPVFKGIKNIP